MQKIQVVAAVFTAIVGSALGTAAQAQALQGEYKLGVLEPLTGNLATQGKLHLEGYEVMRDLINTKFGGVMGKKLVLAYEGDETIDGTKARAIEVNVVAVRPGAAPARV